MFTGGIAKIAQPNLFDNEFNLDTNNKFEQKSYNDLQYEKPYVSNRKFTLSSKLNSTKYIENMDDDDDLISLVEKDLENFYSSDKPIDKNYIRDILSDNTFNLLKERLQLGVAFKIIEDTIIIGELDISDNVDFQELYQDLDMLSKSVYDDCVTIYGSTFSNMLLIFPNSIAYLALILKLFGLKYSNCTELTLYATHIEDFNLNNNTNEDNITRIKLEGGKQIVKMHILKIFMIILLFVVVVLIIVLIIYYVNNNKNILFHINNE